jgi:hypothetical protein
MLITKPDSVCANATHLPLSPMGGLSTARVAMTLAAIAYTDSSQLSCRLADPTLATQGHWQLRWLGIHKNHKALIVQDCLSQQVAVCLCGVETDLWNRAFWYDWFAQDLSTFQPQPWPYSGAPEAAQVMTATLDGLESLLSLTDFASETLLACLQRLLKPANAALTAVVGHGVGGALASVLTLYLQQQFPVNYQFWPITFAAPTVGNAIFADWLDKRFLASMGRYYNRWDVVPYTWTALDWIERSFSNGPKISPLLASVIQRIQLSIRQHDYQQLGSGIALTNQIQPDYDWFCEASYQHACSTYLNLLGAPLLPTD